MVRVYHIKTGLWIWILAQDANRMITEGKVQE